jgi:ketosteroid isomerase-like protein
MKSIYFACLSVVLLALISLAQTKKPPEPDSQNQGVQQTENLDDIRAQEEEAIKHLLVSQIEAWNRGDLEGFMKGYWRSPELTFFSGANVAKGWQAALERYQKNYQSAGKEMGSLQFQDLNIDLLGRQAAVTTGKWQLTMSDGKTPHGLFTLVMKKLPAGWRIVHDHTSREESAQ